MRGDLTLISPYFLVGKGDKKSAKSKQLQLS